MTDEQFAAYYPRYAEVIQKIARKHARADEDLFEDLVAIGMEKLWRLKLEQASSNEDAWIRMSIRNAMRDYKRREINAEHESLSAHLDNGYQVTYDDTTEEKRLLKPRQRTRSSMTNLFYAGNDEDI